jgi:hypothetical protein
MRAVPVSRNVRTQGGCGLFFRLTTAALPVPAYACGQFQCWISGLSKPSVYA